jgi:hypothetical protein
MRALRSPGPASHLVEQAHSGVWEVPRSLRQPLQAPDTEVVIGTHEHGVAQGISETLEHPHGDGKFPLQQLLLQGSGMGRDHQPSAAGGSPQRAREQVGKGLAHARSSFHHQTRTSVEGLDDRGRHPDLLRTQFIAVLFPSEWPVGSEKFFSGHDWRVPKWAHPIIAHHMADGILDADGQTC